MQIEHDVPLAPLTTFHLGGPALFFARATTESELTEALTFAKEQNLPYFILGGGSNVLADDAGFHGLVIKIDTKGVERQDNTYIAAAGEAWDQLVTRAVDDGLWGLENLSGIPGTVGGAVVQNIGAYGAALSQTCSWVEALNVLSHKTVRIEGSKCAFGYRDSVFKHARQYVIVRAAFALSDIPAPNTSYKNLGGMEGASLRGMRQKVLAIRKEKFPDLSREGTAGSFFLNPMVPKEKVHLLVSRFHDMPLFEMPETHSIKVPLGWILDKALHLRGIVLGSARLYEKQALVVVSSRGGSAADVKALARMVKEKVKNEIGIDIAEEVTLM